MKRKSNPKKKKIKNIGKFKKPKNTYKTTKGYLRALYKLNKTEIDEALKGIEDKQGSFIETVLTKSENKTVRKALQEVSRSEVFTSKQERFAQNVLKGMKTFNMYNQFRNMTRSGGKFTAFDRSLLEYQGKNTYLYDGHVLISFSNSPASCNITDLNTGTITVSGKQNK